MGLKNELKDLYFLFLTIQPIVVTLNTKTENRSIF